jgi:glycosyltransferase involved in cell wall biosynthesis
MKILLLSSLFPPETVGGAQLSAWSSAQWLREQGHDVHVLTCATTRADECSGASEDNLLIWRRHFPRPYPISSFSKAKGWKKPLWHALDHFDPRNKKIVAHVLDEIQPDIIFAHYVQGLGYNSLAAIAERDIPVIYFLHDLGLACIRMSMFKRGADCAGWCNACQWSEKFKEKKVAQVSRIGFCSPSKANLDRLGEYFPLTRYPHTVILNANRYPAPTETRRDSDKLRLLYVGRLHETKGIHLLLQWVEPLAQSGRLSMTVVGGGPLEAKLREQYEQSGWCTFTGFVDQVAVSNHIVDSDALCTPSLWLENSPGVIIHALSLGLPVLGSNKGGIVELVQHNRNGLLLPPGDEKAWTDALRGLCDNPNALRRWRAHAETNKHIFEQDYLGKKMLDFAEAIMTAQ